MTLLFIPIVIVAAGFQVARNALQRGLLETAGPWGATLVRFLFGLPFALAWLALLSWLAPAPLQWSAPTFWIACAIGGAAQVLATAALLVSMRRSSFAIGSALQNVRLPIAALIGWALGDPLAGAGWLGVVLASAALLAQSWPKAQAGAPRDWAAAGFGLAAGVLFALSANAFREASQTIAFGHVLIGAAAALAVVQAMQSAVLGLWLVWRDPGALRASLASPRAALGAGFCGFAASAGWFTAFGMAPAAAVQAVGVVEIPMAAYAGRRLFRETLSLRQIVLIGVVAIGVTLTALSVL
jgi:drug/metabolite transporter (DMT)-like permease